MSTQEIVDRELRLTLGDMQVQLIFARAKIAELEETVLQLTSQKVEEVSEKVADKMAEKAGEQANGAAPPVVEVEKKADKREAVKPH